MGRGRKTRGEEDAIEKLLTLASNYLLTNFHKFAPEKRYQLSKALIERRINSIDKNVGERDGDSYITTIIGSFNAGAKGKVSQDELGRIGEIRSLLAENLSKGEPVSAN